MASHGNGRRGIWLPPGTEAVRSSDLHDVVTVREWLQKPMAPASRGEVAAFGEALVKNQVSWLLQHVIEGHEERMVDLVQEMIESAIMEIEEQRWSRRLARWFRRVVSVGGTAQSTGSSVAGVGRTARTATNPADAKAPTAPEPTAPEATPEPPLCPECGKHTIHGGALRCRECGDAAATAFEAEQP